MKLIHLFRNPACAAMFGAALLSPANAEVTTTKSPGIVTLSATLNDFVGSSSTTSGQRHDVVVWVTKADGTFIKTLWKQGPTAFDHVDWVDHFVAWNTARAGSTAIDGFTGATSFTYAATTPNNPISVTWNCRDASNNLVDDGDYKFFIQYAESKTVSGAPEQGPTTSGLTWTKGPANVNIGPLSEGTYAVVAPAVNNFTNISINWIYATVPPTITSATPTATGSMGTPYTYACTATGSAPITYSVASGALPTGLTMTSTGAISGTPIVAGKFDGVIRAENGVAPNADQPFSIDIAQAIVFTSAAPASNGNLVNAYNHTCTVIGTAPVTFSVGSGIMPPGLTLSPAGVISGTPNTLGVFTGKITAHNAIVPDVTQDFSITISPASIGHATLIATLSDYTGTTSTTVPAQHNTVVWVTDASGKFIKTLWKQGNALFTGKDWTDHFVAWNTARAGSEAFDGFTGATAITYATPDSPITVTWNGLDANGNLVDDGDYKFFIQYGENQSGIQGVLTSGLTWHKGLSNYSKDYDSEGAQGTPVNGFNFTNMSVDWDSSVVPVSEVVVEEPLGNPMVQHAAVKDFGPLLINTSGEVVTFTIRNTGNIDLTDLVITKDGANNGDFEVTAPEYTTVAPTATTTFTVQFKPTAAGARSAAIHIASNDVDDSPFDIQLTGTGTLPPAPEIVVEQPAGSNLVDGTAKRRLGTVKVGTSGSPKTYTIKNIGTADLTGLVITKSGVGKNDYIVSNLSASTLGAGESMTFTVTFKPTAKGARNGAIHIKSNDANEMPFDIKLTGTGG